MSVLKMYLAALGRALESSALPLTFLVALFVFAALAPGPRGAGSPPSQVIGRLLGWTVPLLWSSLLLGFAVMAIIQLFKPEIRAAFHSAELARWLHFRDRVGLWPSELELIGVGPGTFGAVLELPIEQLAAQIQAGSDVALASGSHRLEEFLDRIVHPDFEGLQILSQLKFRDDPKARATLAYLVQRKIDELQIRVRYGWKRLLRSLSLALSLVLSIFGVTIFHLSQQNFIGTAFLVLLFSLLGGFFASAARDILAAIEHLRS